MKREGVKIIIVEPYFELKTPESIARETGGKVVVLAPSVGGEPKVVTYMDLFDYDIKTLTAAVKESTSTGANE
jgi:ABC-type Zn uptake system ZnuABC Zn-binding protein ZnuA